MFRFLLFTVLIFQVCYGFAQVPVHEEPRHRPVFQDSEMRILSVQVPPGDTTQFHIHHTPSVFLFFTSTTTGSELQGFAPAVSRSVAGTLLFENLAPPNTRIHRVWNMDTDTFRVMDIELLSQLSGFAHKPMLTPQFKLKIDTSWVRVYQVTVESGKSLRLRSNRSFVLVSMDAGVVHAWQKGRMRREVLQEGTFFRIPQRSRFKLNNTGDTDAHFALLEVPTR